jgi:Protein of unknown function (DUF1360)
MLKPITLLADTLAVYRLTKLVTDDKITEDLRDLIFEKLPRGHKLAYLITCGWCVSIWAGIAIFTLRKVSPETANYVSGILATSAVTGVAYSRGL